VVSNWQKLYLSTKLFAQHSCNIVMFNSWIDGHKSLVKNLGGNAEFVKEIYGTWEKTIMPFSSLVRPQLDRKLQLWIYHWSSLIQTETEHKRRRRRRRRRRRSYSYHISEPAITWSKWPSHVHFLWQIRCGYLCWKK